jgi:hypothetical protein
VELEREEERVYGSELKREEKERERESQWGSRRERVEL